MFQLTFMSVSMSGVIFLVVWILVWFFSILFHWQIIFKNLFNKGQNIEGEVHFSQFSKLVLTNRSYVPWYYYQAAGHSSNCDDEICHDKYNETFYLFLGKLCEVKINSCHSNPCFPGVSCTEMSDSYKCGNCIHGYQGDGVTCKFCQLFLWPCHKTSMSICLFVWLFSLLYCLCIFMYTEFVYCVVAAMHIICCK